MKNKRENNFKRWCRICEPNKKLWFWETFFYTSYTVLLAVFTLFAAKTINSIYEKEWTMAFVFLAIELLLLILRNICLHLHSLFFTKHLTKIRLNIADKIYSKLIASKNNEVKRISKEKVMNTATNNSLFSSEFPDAISVSIGLSFQIAFILVTVFLSNWLAGVIVIGIGIINFFAFLFFNKKLGKVMAGRKSAYESMCGAYNKVLDGKTLINELEAKTVYKKQVLEKVEDDAKQYSKYLMVASQKNNLYFIVWNILIYGITALMLFFVYKGSLVPEVYLVIIPYLASCSAQFNALFDKTSNLENMKVEVDRFDLILKMDEDELVQYGNVINDESACNLSLLNISCKKEKDEKIQKIENLNLAFKANSITLIKGTSNSGKRLLFNILRRTYKPDSGRVVLNNVDLFDYENKNFIKQVFYCSAHPFFIEGSIKENLSLVDEDFRNIKKACEIVGIDGYIKGLKDKYNTDISELTSEKNLFLIGLARAVLSNPKVLMVYEVPKEVPKDFIANLKVLLKELSQKRTIIIFSHNSVFKDIADEKYDFKNGKLI